MPVSTAAIETENASKYLQQLCKHFAHKVPAEYSPERGKVDFPFGVCRMEAEGPLLSISCDCESKEALERAQSVIADHLVRFAWKEKLQFSWGPGAADSATG